jgi:hypothetical protein
VMGEDANSMGIVSAAISEFRVKSVTCRRGEPSIGIKGLCAGVTLDCS